MKTYTVTIAVKEFNIEFSTTVTATNPTEAQALGLQYLNEQASVVSVAEA